MAAGGITDTGGGERTFRERLIVDGYVVLPRLAVEVSLTSISRDLGEPIAAWNGPVVHELVPRVSGTPNTYSGIFGLGRFPFHTDLAHWPVPPRYLVLRCVRGYEDVSTELIDGGAIAAEVGLVNLRRALMTPRRPRSGRIGLVRLSQLQGADEMLRWDEVFLKPASRVGQRVFEPIRSFINEARPTPITLANRGDVAIIDNWRMLHARQAIAADRRDRKLERVYLKGLA